MSLVNVTIDGRYGRSIRVFSADSPGAVGFIIIEADGSSVSKCITVESGSVCVLYEAIEQASLGCKE